MKSSTEQNTYETFIHPTFVSCNTVCVCFRRAQGDKGIQGIQGVKGAQVLHEYSLSAARHHILIMFSSFNNMILSHFSKGRKRS